MRLRNTHICTAALFLGVATAWIGNSPRPSRALPIYTRRFDVSCDTCHTVVPALNGFGQAFQANHFNWPIGKPPQHRLGVDAVPISGLATYIGSRDNTFNMTTDQFASLELFASNGFTPGHGHSGLASLSPRGQGGYFVDYYAGTGNAIWGQLGNAFVSIPVAGAHGEFALTAGQFTPLMYQYDPLNSLARSLPAALSTGADAFALTSALPGARLEYFDARGRGTANGDYVNVGVPFQGFLSLNNMSDVGGPRGFYVDAFRRQDRWSAGLYGYRHDSNYVQAVVGTYAPCPALSFLAAAGAGKDVTGTSHEYSVEGQYTPRADIGVTARIDNVESPFASSTTYPVFTVTYYPARQNVIRLVGETVQNAHDRTSTVYVFGQF